MPVDLSLRIASHEDLGASHHLLTLSSDGAVPAWEPGQFAMLSPGRPAQSVDPLLRRPFSIFNRCADGGVLQIFYKIMGRGTRMLSDARPGEHLRCLAPLGNGFAPASRPGSRLLLVAGGIGSASLHALALVEKTAGRNPVVLYGCRTSSDLAGILPTQQADVDCRLATDDGSAGGRGLVSDLLDEFLTSEGPGAPDRWIICACGPHLMMKATAEVAARHRVPCHLSLESPMACGFGVCVGCVVGVRETERSTLTYNRICVEGPVFDAGRICW